MGRNFGQTAALEIHLPNGFIALHPLAPCLFSLPGSLRTGNGRGNGSRGGSRAYHADWLEGFTMTMKDAFHHFRKVFLYVEAVGDLHRLRGSAACSGSIVTRAITTDELDLWMGLEPAFQAAGLAASRADRRRDDLAGRPAWCQRRRCSETPNRLRQDGLGWHGPSVGFCA